MSRQKNSKTVTPPVQENESLPTSAPSSPPMPDPPSSTTSSNPPATDDPHSYRPPGVDRSIPTPQQSATEESPSLTKSSASSPRRKTNPVAARKDSNDDAPAKDPVLGSGGLAYLEYAADVFLPEMFRDFYGHRAAMLLKHHEGKLSQRAAEALEALLPK